MDFTNGPVKNFKTTLLSEREFAIGMRKSVVEYTKVMLCHMFVPSLIISCDEHSGFSPAVTNYMYRSRSAGTNQWK